GLFRLRALAEHPRRAEPLPGALPMSWASQYVGREFREADQPQPFTCWTLVRSVLLEQCSIDIETFAGIKSWESPRIQEVVAAAIARDDWIKVERAEVRPFDVALIWVWRRLMGRDTAATLSHVGIVTPGRHRPRILHVEHETHSVCVPFETLGERLHSFYR